MPRYYFDAQDGAQFCDPDGTELPNFAAAKREAYKILCQLLPGKEAHVLESGTFTLTLSDEDRLVLMTLDVATTLSPAARAL